MDKREELQPQKSTPKMVETRTILVIYTLKYGGRKLFERLSYTLKGLKSKLSGSLKGTTTSLHLDETMITLGGSPTAVAVPPMFENTTWMGKRKGW